MKSPNPFSVKTPAQPSRIRAVILLVLSVQAVGLSLLLMQGCKPAAQAAPPADLATASADTNLPSIAAPLFPSNNTPASPITPPTPAPVTAAVTAPAKPLPVAMTGPAIAPQNLPLAEAAPAPAQAGYTVLAGDTFYKIATAHHVSLRALKNANPGVSPRKLKIGQVLNLPSA